MNKYKKVKGYYEQGLWDEHRVANAVIKGWITSDEYETIIGKPYEEV